MVKEKQMIHLSKILCLLILLSFFCLEALADVDVYKINLKKLNDYYLIEKGNTLGLSLVNYVSPDSMRPGSRVDFNSNEYNASGIVVKSLAGGRFSMSGIVQISANKIVLEDGREVYISAISPEINAAHPSHANTNRFALARAITSFSIAASPATFGASLGVGFLIGGLLSAYKNGIKDFIWGGFNGSGLSFVEGMLRKQPDVYIPEGTYLPFVLTRDIKIPAGVQKEKISQENINREEARGRISQLLEWGDLTGALEYSIKTNQKEIYDELMNKISEN